jgi:Chaperone of endosialidase
MANSDFIVKNGLVVNTSLLSVRNGKVGINTLTPGQILSVNGNTEIFGFANVIGNCQITGVLNVNTATISTINATGGLSVSGATTFANTISVSGAATFSNQMNFSGNGTFNGILSVNGAATFSNTITVTGAATFANQMNFSGNGSFTGAVSIGGDTNISGILNVTNSTTNLRLVNMSNNVTISGLTTMNTSVTTGVSQIQSLGVGTPASGTTGEIRAYNNITAYYSSDASLKENIKPITNALDKVMWIDGVEFDWTDDYIKQNGGEDGYFIRKHDVGVIADQLEKVLPEVVVTREDGTKAVKYERVVALLIEAIKELNQKIQ